VSQLFTSSSSHIYNDNVVLISVFFGFVFRNIIFASNEMKYCTVFISSNRTNSYYANVVFFGARFISFHLTLRQTSPPTNYYMHKYCSRLLLCSPFPNIVSFVAVVIHILCGGSIDSFSRYIYVVVNDVIFNDATLTFHFPFAIVRSVDLRRVVADSTDRLLSIVVRHVVDR